MSLCSNAAAHIYDKSCIINHDLQLLTNWVLLTLKTRFLSATCFDSIPVSFVDSYLSVTLSSNRQWHSYIEKTFKFVNSATQRLGIARKMKHYISIIISLYLSTRLMFRYLLPFVE